MKTNSKDQKNVCFFTKKEVAMLLKISLSSVDRYRNEGKLKFIILGRTVRFPANQFYPHLIKINCDAEGYYSHQQALVFFDNDEQLLQLSVKQGNTHFTMINDSPRYPKGQFEFHQLTS